MLARLTSGSVGFYFFAYPRVSNKLHSARCPERRSVGTFFASRDAEAHLVFVRLSAHSAGAYTFYTLDTVAHNASARAPPTPGTPGRVWKSIAFRAGSLVVFVSDVQSP